MSYSEDGAYEFGFICNLYCSPINKYVIVIISNVEMKTNQSTKQTPQGRRKN